VRPGIVISYYKMWLWLVMRLEKLMKPGKSF
jgi:hypothetical protein